MISQHPQDFKSATEKFKFTETTIFINHLGIPYLGRSGVELGGFWLSRLQNGYSYTQNCLILTVVLGA